MQGSEERDAKGVKNVKLLIDSVRGGKRHAGGKREGKNGHKGKRPKRYQ